MISLGFVSAVLADSPLEEVIGTAAELGYDCVELLCWPASGAGVSHVDVDALDEREVRRIEKICRDAGVSISALGYYANLMDEEEGRAARAVEHFEKVIDAAAALGIGRANTFLGRPQHSGREAAFERFRRTWPPIVHRAEQRGVRIGIENFPLRLTDEDPPGGGNLAVSPALWRRIFAELPSDHFGLNYDPSHLVWQQMDPVKPLYEFRDELFHLHIKDTRVLRVKLDEVGILAPPLEFHEPKLPGLGEVDWSAFFSTLTDIGYRGPACVEVEDAAYEGSAADRRASLLQSMNYLRQFLPR